MIQRINSNDFRWSLIFNSMFTVAKISLFYLFFDQKPFKLFVTTMDREHWYRNFRFDSVLLSSIFVVHKHGHGIVK